MAKASPMIRSFSAGEFSALLDGRVDIDRYASSTRKMMNYVAAPQGPAIARSGTMYVNSVHDHAYRSVLVPFVFSSDQATVLEFSTGRIRFFSEDGGLQVYTAVEADIVSSPGSPLTVDTADLNADEGDEVVLSGVDAHFNMNNETVGITDVTGDVYTLNVTHPVGLAMGPITVARVYHVECDYSEAERRALRAVQSVDVMYLLTGKSQPRKLSRYGVYDWRLEDVKFVDGPYMPVNETETKLTPSATGNAVPVMTANTDGGATAAGSSKRGVVTGSVATPVDFLGRNLTYSMGATEYFHAFDANDETYWAANAQQSGYIEYTPAVPFAADGYVIYPSKDNKDLSYGYKDYAPSTFYFSGWNGTAWIELDRQENYVLYDGDKSAFFELKNTVVYSKYRLTIEKLYRNGLIEPRVRRLVIRSDASATFTLTASDTEGINRDVGFLDTDVGRLIRIKGEDGAWRSCEITARTSATEVTVTLAGEPLLSLKAIREWRLGYWSDTTGWPGTGDFFDDRLYLAGSDEAPDLIAGSVVGAYETFSQTASQGEVLDDAAVVVRLNARKLSRVLWVASDTRGLLIGTGSEEYVLSSGSDAPLTARAIKARPATRRGSAPVEPVRIDNQMLYVQRSGRAVREFAYVFEADGYKSPSMSQLASHFGVSRIEEMVYAQEPHSIVWVRRADGSLLGLTYNREENVVGWHQHDISGGRVESITVIPQSDGLQDALWMVVARGTETGVRRSIERLTRFWDFDTSLDQAHFVDCALRYIGDETDTVYGLQHLEGWEVYGLADRRPFGPVPVVNGSISIPYTASNIIVGLGFDGECWMQRLEAGGADGTAQGKTKRINNISVMLWRSFGGQIGVYNTEREAFVYDPIAYPGDYSVVEDMEVFTGVLQPITPEGGYDQNGYIAFRRGREEPLPLNMVAIMPQLNTQDR